MGSYQAYWQWVAGLPIDQRNEILILTRQNLLNLQNGMAAYRHSLTHFLNQLSIFARNFKQDYLERIGNVADAANLPDIQTDAREELAEIRQQIPVGSLFNIAMDEINRIFNDIELLLALDPVEIYELDSQGQLALSRLVAGENMFTCATCDAAVLARLNEAWARAANLQNPASMDMLKLAGALIGFLDDGDLSADELSKIGQSLGFEDVQWQGHANQSTSLNFLTTVAHIIAYFDESINMLNEMASSGDGTVMILDADGNPTQLDLQGATIFEDFFGTNASIGEAVTVYLGANEQTGDARAGLVPLPSSTQDTEALSGIYLGSDISVATMAHEFGHQLDRSLADGSNPFSTGVLALTLPSDLGIPLNNRNAMGAYEATVQPEQTVEIIPDHFTTEVLDEMGFEGTVVGVNTLTGETYNLVQWRDTDQSQNASIALTAFWLGAVDDTTIIQVTLGPNTATSR